MSEVLERSERNGVLTLAFNRPEKLNAFNDELTQALLVALRDAERQAEVRCVVLRGTGRGYCAGQDLEAFVRNRGSVPPVSVAAHLKSGYNVITTRIRRLEKPVIASINGIAAGVGLSIALACDIRIAAEDALFTLGFSKIGLIPDGGASLLLPVLVGLGRGLELAMTSDRIDALQAYRIGLVNRVVPTPELATATTALAEQLAGQPALALALTKRAFNRAMLPNLPEWLEEEADLQELAAAGPDHTEGVSAFMEKRAPVFGSR